MRCHPSQFLQLLQTKQPVLDEHLARRRRLVSINVVVFRNRFIDVRRVNPAIETSDVGSGDWILDRAVPGEVRPKDFAWAEIRKWRHQRSREWAPEVRQNAELESSRQFCISAKRELVGAIQHRGSEEAVGLDVVDCANAKVLVGIDRDGWYIAAGILEPG